MIGRGTTPTIGYIIEDDLDPTTFVVAYLTMVQGSTVVEKDITSMHIDNNVIYWELTQEETLLFDDDDYVDIQIRVRTNEGRAYDSMHSRESVLGINKNGVI